MGLHFPIIYEFVYLFFWNLIRFPFDHAVQLKVPSILNDVQITVYLLIFSPSTVLRPWNYFTRGSRNLKNPMATHQKKWALKCRYPSIYVKLMDLLSKKIPKWCANRSQVLFFRPDAMSSTRFLFWRRATSQQDVPLQSVDIIVSELFAHFLVGEVKAGWRESRGGLILRWSQLPIPHDESVNPQHSPHRPRIREGESYAGASVGGANLASLTLPRVSLVKWIREKHISSS